MAKITKIKQVSKERRLVLAIVQEEISPGRYQLRLDASGYGGATPLLRSKAHLDASIRMFLREKPFSSPLVQIEESETLSLVMDALSVIRIDGIMEDT